MTTNHAHTPSTEEVRNGYSRKPPGHAVSTARERHGEEFDRWHAAEIAAAEQRRAVQELRDIVGSLIDWEVMYGYEEGTPEIHEAHRIAAWLTNRADQMEENNETH